MTAQVQRPSAIAQLVNPATRPTEYNFAFGDFLKREYHFNLESRAPCKAFEQGHCPLGDECPDKHEQRSSYSNLICKHWLRGLCKKGDTCEFLHEYNLRMMPECTQYSRHLSCPNGADCLYLHLDPILKQPPCPHYERGFCPLGPYCAARHVKRKNICKYYLAGFCPNGIGCEEGAHPLWREKEDMKKPEVKKVLSAEELEEERERLASILDRQREEGRRNFEERGHQGRPTNRGRRERRPYDGDRRPGRY